MHIGAFGNFGPFGTKLEKQEGNPLREVTNHFLLRKAFIHAEKTDFVSWDKNQKLGQIP